MAPDITLVNTAGKLVHMPLQILLDERVIYAIEATLEDSSGYHSIDGLQGNPELWLRRKTF
jgi:hypothetical protein